MSKVKKNREEIIKRAFLDLVGEKGFGKVSVKDIAERSGITRGTFYLYFEDKYELAEKIERDLMNGLFDATRTIPFKSLAVFGMYSDEYTRCFVDYFYEHGENFTLLLGENGDPSFETLIKKISLEYWKDKDIKNEMSVPENYAVTAVLSLSTGLVTEWVKNDFKESKEEFILILEKLSKNFLQNIFKK